jgi:hypothetical protein
LDFSLLFGARYYPSGQLKCFSDVQVAVSVICQSPVLTLSGWKLPVAARTTEANKQITATESGLRISSFLKLELHSSPVLRARTTGQKLSGS